MQASIKIWSQDFGQPCDQSPTLISTLVRAIPDTGQDSYVAREVLVFYSEHIKALVPRVRLHIVSQFRPLYTPLVLICGGMAMATRFNALRHLQPCFNLVAMYASGCVAQATLIYQSVLRDLNTATISTEDDILSWKQSDLSKRVLMLSPCTDTVTGFKCDVKEFFDLYESKCKHTF
jgi:hypothetical protein